MDELYVDSKLVDLGDNTKVGITMQVNDIAEMEDRQGNFSNTFKTPKTQTNQKIYEHADVVNSGTVMPYRKLPVKYVQDGIELVPSGYCKVVSAGNFYEQTIYSGILDFFSQIKGKKMSDLDLSAYDHTWDLATVFGSRLNTDGYIYSIIDWSDDQAYIDNVTRQVDARTLFVNMFCSTLVEKIFEPTSYSFDGAVTLLPKYLKRLFPFQLDKLEYPEDYVSEQLFRARRNKKIQTFTVPAQTAAPVGQNVVTLNDDSSVGYFDNPKTFNTTTGKWTVSATGKYTFTVDTIISITNCATYNIAVFRERGGVDTLIDQLVVGVGGSVTNQVRNFTTVQTSLLKGDIIRLEIGAITTATSTLIIHTGTAMKNAFDKTIQWGGDIFMSSLIGDMNQEDFLKALANQLAIVFVPDNVDKVIHFKQFKELYDNIPNAVDMSDKIDDKQEIKVTYRKSGYAQKNWLKYREDSSNTVKGYGDGFFFIGDENLDLEKTLFTLPFAASEDVVRLIGLGVVKIPKLHAGAFTNKTQPRMIMLNSSALTGGDLVYVDGVGGSLQSSASIPLTYFIDDGENDSLGFDRNLLNQEWNKFVNNIMNNFKQIDASFRLSIKDVHNFDFFKPWYFAQYSNYFYVNKIKDFIKNRLTGVELIKM